ncbi:MAG TPA: tRNA pseudouridine(13) synthase TruD [Thermoplasmata archaeon]|nr:tRNA pseudouridine(13) synthase TruD [Thermoplasmata archaeon]
MKIGEHEKKIGIEVYFTEEEGIGGKLKTYPQDFIVDEEYIKPEPEETGAYTWALIRTTNMETNRLVREFSRALTISRDHIFFSGNKDKRAVTTQQFSFRVPVERVLSLSLKNVEVLEAHTTRQHVTLGDLLGNRFDIVLRGVRMENEEKRKEVLSRIQSITKKILDTKGYPNFFGIQRFGNLRPVTHIAGKYILLGDFEKAVKTYIGSPSHYESEELQRAREIFSKNEDAEASFEVFPKNCNFERTLLYHLIHNPGDYVGALKKLPKNLLIMFVHSYQAYLFNRILSERIRRGYAINEPLVGDVIVPADEYGLPTHHHYILVKEHNLNKISKMVKMNKGFIGGLVFGSKSEFAQGEPGEIERKIIEMEGMEQRNFVVPEIPECSSSGLRREIISVLKHLFYQAGKDWVRFIFRLNKGCYATSLLREYMKSTNPYDF